MRKVTPFLLLVILSCGSKVTGTIPGITTEPLDIVVRNICKQEVPDRIIVVKSDTGEIIEKTDDNGSIHIENVARPYSITFGNGNSYITYYSSQSPITVYDPYKNCEEMRNVRFYGTITAEDEITGPLKLFIFPGGVTTLSGSGSSIPYDITFPISQTSIAVYLIAVEYRNDEPFRAGKGEAQLPAGITEVSNALSLNYSFSRILEGRFDGFDDRDKVTLEYTFLFGGSTSSSVYSKEFLHGINTYQIKIPDKSILNTGEKIAVFADAELFNNATQERSEAFVLSTFDKADYPSSGNISINFPLITPPVITSPQSGDTISIDNLKLVWDFAPAKVPDYYAITLERQGGAIEWIIIIDHRTSEISEFTPQFPSELTQPFRSANNYILTLFAIKAPKGGVLDFLKENLMAVEGGYVVYTERRITFR